MSIDINELRAKVEDAQEAERVSLANGMENSIDWMTIGVDDLAELLDEVERLRSALLPFVNGGRLTHEEWQLILSIARAALRSGEK